MSYRCVSWKEQIYSYKLAGKCVKGNALKLDSKLETRLYNFNFIECRNTLPAL